MITREVFTKYLDQKNIHYNLVEHPAADTVEELDRLGVSHNGVIVERLFLYDRQQKIFYMILLRGNRLCDMIELQRTLNLKNMEVVREDKLRRGFLSKFKLGEITSSNQTKIKVLIDRDLYGAPSVGFSLYEAGVTMFVALSDMEEAIRAHGNEVVYVDIMNRHI